jgi:hypothetical protein
MFNMIAKTLTEIRHEAKTNIEKRCEKAFELAKG